jgi:hypothetical protein
MGRQESVECLRIAEEDKTMKRARLRAAQLIVAVLVFASPALAQMKWWRTYGGTDRDVGYSVQQTSDSGYIIAGLTYSFGAGNFDVYLIKTSAAGDTLWTRTYGGTDDDRGYSAQQTSDGGYIIAGFSEFLGAEWYDVYFIKTDANGDTAWTRTCGGTGVDAGRSVQQTSDGGYIIAGYTESFGAGNLDVYLIKTDASGDILWTGTYGGTGDDGGLSVQQASDGGYIIAGYTSSFGVGGRDVYLIKTSVSGDTVWTRTYGGTGDDGGLSVRQASDGGYIIAGFTEPFGAGDYDVYLIKTDASGDTLWTKTYGGTNNDYGSSVQQTSDGGYIIAGYTESFGAGNLDVYLIKTDASGDTLWTKTYGGTNNDYGSSVQQTSDGGYIIAGYTESFGAGNLDVYLIKTDANGNVAVEEPPTPQLADSRTALRVQPNPFSSFAAVPGHEAERFVLSDVSGRMVGICNGDRIGEGLAPGVYFLSPVKLATPCTRPLRIVKD